MSVHSIHPAIDVEGLADNCERCAEIADDVFIGLDDDNLMLLVARTRAWMKDREFPRSDTENRAMSSMEKMLRNADRLCRIEEKLEEAQRQEDGPSDDEIYNRVGVEGGIGYDTTADEPGSMGENDWRL